MAVLRDQLLTTSDVMEWLSVRRSTLRRLRLEEGFPVPLKVGATNRWVKHEVDAWLKARPRHELRGGKGSLTPAA